MPDQAPGSDFSVRLFIPAHPKYLHLLRAVAASVAGRMDFPYDAIDDLRLAVAEASAQVMVSRSPSCALTMIVNEQSQSVTVDVATDATTSPWPPDGLRQSLAWKVMSALTDEAEIGQDATAPSISLTKKVS